MICGNLWAPKRLSSGTHKKCSLIVCRGLTTDEIWAALAAEYESWRDRLCVEFAAVGEGTKMPQYNTANWWRLLTYEKLRNFELTTLPKTYIERTGPLDASGKPVQLASESEEETSSDCSDQDCSDIDQSTDSATHQTSKASVTDGCTEGFSSHPTTRDKPCGDIGAGYCNHLVYSQQEQGLQRRSPEASYLRDHVQALQNNGLGISNIQFGPESVAPPSMSAIGRNVCEQLFQRQQRFFSDLDACHPSSEPPPPGRQSASGGDGTYDTAHMEASSTPTCAIDAAIMLTQNGYLHVPQLREVNVKQAGGVPFCFSKYSLCDVICAAVPSYSACPCHCVRHVPFFWQHFGYRSIWTIALCVLHFHRHGRQMSCS